MQPASAPAAGPTTNASGQQQIKLSSQNGSQTVTLLIPQNAMPSANTSTPKQQVVVQQSQSSKTGSKTTVSSASASNQTGIPLGLTYAPVQVMPPTKQEPDHWTKLEEIAESLWQEVQYLRNAIKTSRQKSQATIHDLQQQLLAKKEQGSWSRERNSNRKLCANCNRPATVACARCERAFYCGEFCVRRDSPLHRQVCMAQQPTVEMVSIE